VSQTKTRSSVRRDARMEYISVGRYDERGQRTGEYRILGLFNSKATSESATLIPLLRGKLQQMFDLDGAVAGSHDYRQILLIFNSLPRSDLFNADPNDLHREIRAIMSLEEQRGVRLLLRPDAMGRGISVTVRIPRDRFNAQVRSAIQAHLLDILAGESVDYQLTLGEEGSQARLHFFVATEMRIGDVDRQALEETVVAIAQSWRDRLRSALL
jgi:glutamate dehydrogenase